MGDHDYVGGDDHSYAGSGGDDDVEIELLDINFSGIGNSCGATKPSSDSVRGEAISTSSSSEHQQKLEKITETLFGDGRGNYWKKVEEASSSTILRLKCIESISVHKCLARATLKVATSDLKELNKHNHQPNIRSASDINSLKEAELKSRRESKPKKPRNDTSVGPTIIGSNNKNLVAKSTPTTPIRISQPQATSTPNRFNVSSTRGSLPNAPTRKSSLRSLPNPCNIHHLNELFNSGAYSKAINLDGVKAWNAFQGQISMTNGDMVGFWFANESFLSNAKLSLEIHTFGMDQLQLPESYPVSYLFTIYFIYEDVCVPVLYALLQKASQEVYAAVLRLFKDKLNFSLNGVDVLIGYNTALRKAAYDVFPFLLPKACRFHYCLSLLNQMEEFKLKQVFNRHPTGFLLIKMLIALPFLPHRPREELPDFITLDNCWKAIISQAGIQNLLTSTTLKPFLDHFQNYWIKTIGPRMISVFDVSYKMNELVELFNSQILLLIHDSPPFWFFYESLQNLDRKNVDAFLTNKTREPVTGRKPLQDQLMQIFRAHRTDHFNLISLMAKLALVPAGLIETYMKAYYPDKEKYISNSSSLVPVKEFDSAVLKKNVSGSKSAVFESHMQRVSILKRPSIATSKLAPPTKLARTSVAVASTPNKVAPSSTQASTPNAVVAATTMDSAVASPSQFVDNDVILHDPSELVEQTPVDVEIIDDGGAPSSCLATTSKNEPVVMVDLSSDDDVEELPTNEATFDAPVISNVRSLGGLESEPDFLVNDNSVAELSLAEPAPLPFAAATTSTSEKNLEKNEIVLHDVNNELLISSSKVFCHRFKTYVYYDGKGYWFFSHHGKLQCIESKTSFRCKATATLSSYKLLAPIITNSPHSHGPIKTDKNVVDTEAFLARLEEQFPTGSDERRSMKRPICRIREPTKANELSTITPPLDKLDTNDQQTASGSKDNPSSLGTPRSAKPHEANSTANIPDFTIDARGQRKYARPKRYTKADLKTFYEPRDLSKLKKIFLNPVCNKFLKIRGCESNFCQSFIRPKGGELIGFWLCNKEFICDFVKKAKIDAVCFESLELPVYKNLPLQHLIVVFALSSNKATDLIYVLSLKPNYECYNAVTEMLKTHIKLDMSNMRVIVGFENYARETISTAFPEAKIESCWAHFSRAIMEMLSELRLLQTVKTNLDAMNIIRLIVALPLLPPDKIDGYGDLSLKGGWKHINREASRRGLSNTLKPLMDFVRFEWINRLGPEKFSIFKAVVSAEYEILELNALVESHRAELYSTCQESDKFWGLYEKLLVLEKSYRDREIHEQVEPSSEASSINQINSIFVIKKALEDVKNGESSIAQFMSAVGTSCPIPLEEKRKIPDKSKKDSKVFDIDNDSSEENAEESTSKQGIPSVKIKRFEDCSIYYDGVGHYYHCTGNSAKKRQLRCVEKKTKFACPGSASMFKEPPNAPIQLIKSHNHPPNVKHHIHTAPFLEAVKKRYFQDEKNFKKIFDEELENFPLALQFVTPNSIRQQVIRCARKATTPKPVDLAQLAWILQNPQNRLKWSSALKTCKPYFQGIFKNSEDKISGVWLSHLGFAQSLPTDYATCFEAVYLTDMQVLGIEGVEKIDTVFFVINGMSIPVLCAILSDSSEETYAGLVKALFSSFVLGPQTPVILPPIINLLKAAKRVAPSVRITPSWFYYNQAVLKKLEELNFKPKIKNQAKSAIVRMFMALALLPATPQDGLEGVSVEKGLEHILAEVEKFSMNNSLLAFLKHYQEFWMNEITPEAFSCYHTQQFNEFIEDSFLKLTVSVKLMDSLWKIYIKLRSAEFRIRRKFLHEIKVPSADSFRKESPWTMNKSYIEETFTKYQEGRFTFGEMLECLGSCHTGALESFLQGRTDLKLTGLPEKGENREAAADDQGGDHEYSVDLPLSDDVKASYDAEKIMKDSVQNPIPSVVINHRNREFTVYHDGRGYYYRGARKSAKRRYLRCVESRGAPFLCRANAYMDVEPPNSPIVITKPHNHPPYIREYSGDQVEFVEAILERALNSDEPVRKIYEDELKKKPHLRQKVTYQTVRRSLYSQRRSGFPPVPSTLTNFEQLVLDPKHSKFALVRDGIAVFIQGRITSANGEALGLWMANKEFVLSIGRKCKLDAAGVLAVQPKMAVFRHFIVVYVLVNGMCVPVLYAMLMVDSEECFIKTMEIVRDDLNLNFNDLPLMIGFEFTLEKAAKKVFPQTETSFSWFHFMQCVLRHVEELGLSKTMTDKPQLLCLLRLLMALPLLPPDEDKSISLIKGWESVLTFTDSNNLFALVKPVLVKFRSYWIDTIGCHSMSVFGSRLKIASVVEELHLKCDEYLRNRMPFWTLYERIRQIESDYRKDFDTRQKLNFSMPPPDETYWPLMEELGIMAARDDVKAIDVLKRIACSDIRFLESIAQGLPSNYLDLIENYLPPDEPRKSDPSGSDLYYMTVMQDEPSVEVHGYSEFDENRIFYEINDDPIPSVALSGRNNSTVYYDGRGHYYHIHHKGQKRYGMRCVENKTKYACKCKGYMERDVPNSPILLLPNNHHSHVPFIRDYIDKFPTVEHIKQYQMDGLKTLDESEGDEDNQAAQAAMMISNSEFP